MARKSLAARAGRAVRGVRKFQWQTLNPVHHIRRRSERVRQARPDPDMMTLQEHLLEFRSRLVKAILGVVVGMVIGFLLAGRVLNYMTDIAKGVSATVIFQVIEPADGFTTYFKIALYIGIIIASPIIFYQIVRFLAPGLMPNELRYLLWGIPSASFLFLAGVVFANTLVIPRFLEFLINFTQGIGFAWQPTASSYLTFFIRISLGMGIVFQLPALLFVLAKVRVVNMQKLRKWRKFAFLICAVAAAAIVPTPDPFNMFIVLIPMYALYELGTVLSYFALPRGERGPFMTRPRLPSR